MENLDDNEEGAQGGGFRADLVKSYLTFGRRAIRARWKVTAGVISAGLLLTILANSFIPRTYTCTTVLQALDSQVLEQMNGNYNPLSGASGLILSHDNLESMIRDTGLIAKAAERRPPLMRLKDRLSALISGPQLEKAKLGGLVGTLETKIQVTPTGSNLEIDADWSDGQTAAELAQSARESFLKARHNADVYAFEEKVAILDQHATKLREEIEQLAQQINTQTERATADASTVPTPSTTSRPVTLERVLAAPRPAEPDAELPLLKERLTEDKQKLIVLEADHERQVRDENAKLADLKLRFTAAHPQVVTQQQRVALVSGAPAELQMLRAEIASTTDSIKARESMAARNSGEPVTLRSLGAVGASGGGEPLTPAVVQALQKGDTDQALAQQLSGAVVRYGLLRDDIGSGRIALDTAQAAFNHRYQIIVPVEVPLKPKKPKAIVIWGAGLTVSLLLALLIPIIAELRKGILIERWQIEQLQLPILAELHLPKQPD